MSRLRKECCRGILDRFGHQAQDKGHEVSGAAEREVDEGTGGTYGVRVDTGRQWAEEVPGEDRDRPAQPVERPNSRRNTRRRATRPRITWTQKPPAAAHLPRAIPVPRATRPSRPGGGGTAIAVPGAPARLPAYRSGAFGRPSGRQP
ncbi:hypothetical protein JS756_18350 [Streptomyces actuosus]|uniref:Uncharacterized protein n=1 Tax=Streptomyces actuosus TaxID=1885 RepID=A0ABS2VSD2_STRAS|nr:hypothetical protein [Streptomyces actuosus]MBN0046029.1 hypothetical protein [Streptomyces actuosus]